VPRAPSSSAHPPQALDFPSLHPLHQCRSAAYFVELPASATRPSARRELAARVAFTPFRCCAGRRGVQGGMGNRRAACSAAAGGTTFPQERGRPDHESSPRQRCDREGSGHFPRECPHGGDLVRLHPSGAGAQRITTRWPTSAVVMRIERYRKPVTPSQAWRLAAVLGPLAFWILDRCRTGSASPARQSALDVIGARAVRVSTCATAIRIRHGHGIWPRRLHRKSGKT